MGDDVNDIGALKLSGLAAAPANAHYTVLEIATFISKHPGGNGAVRELMDTIISSRESRIATNTLR
jgi:3-deoxy-D-manno-octulosonate 8-phosphate phosphatase KdsC-like HAD superfamily phosphatase